MRAPHSPDRRHAQRLPEIEAAIRDLITAYATGRLGESQFVEGLLQLEEKLSARGFVLTAANTADDWTLVLLHVKGRGEPCAVYEFLPGRGKMRRCGVTGTTGALSSPALKAGPRKPRKDTEKRRTRALASTESRL